MATVDPQQALSYYQARVGAMLNDVMMRDVAIADLEERCRALEEENAALRSSAEPQGYAAS